MIFTEKRCYFVKNDIVGRNWKQLKSGTLYFDTDFKVQNNLHFFSIPPSQSLSLLKK